MNQLNLNGLDSSPWYLLTDSILIFVIFWRHFSSITSIYTRPPAPEEEETRARQLTCPGCPVPVFPSFWWTMPACSTFVPPNYLFEPCMQSQLSLQIAQHNYQLHSLNPQLNYEEDVHCHPAQTWRPRDEHQFPTSLPDQMQIHAYSHRACTWHRQLLPNKSMANLPQGEHLRKEAAPKWGKVCRKHAGRLSLRSISLENTPLQFNPILSIVQMKLYTVVLFRQAHYIRVDDVRRNQACRLVSQTVRCILFLEMGPLRVAGKSMPH
jgi:hypothetical protein